MPVHLSFDEAANQEYVNVQEQENAFGMPERISSTIPEVLEGDQTPRGSMLGADNDEPSEN